MEHFESLMPDARLAQALRDLFVDELQAVYGHNVGRFEEDRGDDRLTFGVTVWRNAWFALEKALRNFDPRVETSRPHGSFVIRVGNVSIYAYKIGDTAKHELDMYQLEASLTKDMFVRANTDQLSFFDPPQEGAPMHLVLGHAGNIFEGLTLVEIGLPSRDAQGRTHWEWTERFFALESGEAADGSGTAPPYPSFDESPVTEAELALRGDEREDEGPVIEPNLSLHKEEDEEHPS